MCVLVYFARPVSICGTGRGWYCPEFFAHFIAVSQCEFWQCLEEPARSLGANRTGIAHFNVNAVQIKDGINGVQRAALPLADILGHIHRLPR